MSLSDEELKGIGGQALNMAKRDLERNQFNFLLATYHESDKPPLHRMTRIEKLIIDRLGVNWLNQGRTKDIGFKLLRAAVDLWPPEAVVLAVACNGFSPTAKLHALPAAQQEELRHANHDRHHQAVKEGLLDICDILLATVQTPERICFYEHKYDPRRRKFIGQAESRVGPQDGFDGRIKMFGEVSDRAFTR